MWREQMAAICPIARVVSQRVAWNRAYFLDYFQKLCLLVSHRFAFACRSVTTAQLEIEFIMSSDRRCQDLFGQLLRLMNRKSLTTEQVRAVIPSHTSYDSF